MVASAIAIAGALNGGSLTSQTEEDLVKFIQSTVGSHPNDVGDAVVADGDSNINVR